MVISSQPSILRDRARQSFVKELNTKIGSLTEKNLIVEKSLISILDMNFRFSELENLAKVVRIIEWSVSTAEQQMMISDDNGPVNVFLVRSMSMETLPLLTSLSAVVSKISRQIYIFFVPSMSVVGVNRLNAIFGDEKKRSSLLSIGEIPNLDSVMIENDLISLKLGDEIFSRVECQFDPSNLLMIAKFLKRLEMQFGLGVGHAEIMVKNRKFRKINSIGPSSKIVCDMFLKMNLGDTEDIAANPVMSTSAGDNMVGMTRMGGLKTIAGCLAAKKADITTRSASVEVDNENFGGINDAIDSVVLIDRRTDLWSVLCSQFTYEALIDEKFGIENGRVKFSSSTNDSPQPMTLSSSADPLFAEVRDIPVSQIGQILSSKANYISECYKEKDSLKSISEIKDFMDKFKVIQGEHASLSSHVALATECSDWARRPEHTYMLKVEDQIMSMSKPIGKIFWKLEKLIRRDVGVEAILRLLCLTSLVYGAKALSGAGVDKVLRSLVNRFGPQVIKTVFRLEQAGLLSFHHPGATGAGVVSEIMSGVGASKSKWPRIREEFRLILEANNENMDPGNALAEAYSGYVPLSIRLVQLLNSSWKTCADKLGLLRGPAIEIVQECPVATSGGVATGNSINVAVVFIGGVTYGEMAALRKLSQLEGGKRRFIVITTDVANYKRILSII